jgi:prepilin peptidase CpaA
MSDLVVPAVVIAGTVAAAFVDLKTRRVPNVLTMPLAAIGVLLAATGVSHVGLAASVLGGIVGLVVMLPGHVLGATGAGDVKLLAAVGTLLGPRGVILAFIGTAIAGGVLALIVAARRGTVRPTLTRTALLVSAGRAGIEAIEAPQANNRFAYAPAIAIGAAIAALQLVRH